MDGFLEILTGGGSKVMEIQVGGGGGGLNLKNLLRRSFLRIFIPVTFELHLSLKKVEIFLFTYLLTSSYLNRFFHNHRKYPKNV